MADLTKYIKYRSEMQSGDLIEWKGNTVVGRIIRFFTKQIVNHTSVVDLPYFHRYTVPHKFILEALSGGIDLNLLSEEIARYDGEVYWLQLKDEHSKARDSIAAWSVLQCSKKYDYGSLFKNMFGKVSGNARKLFCSEFAYLGAKQAKLPVSEKAWVQGDPAKSGIYKEPVRIA